MDENFLQNLKAYSVQDILDDQRPTTSVQRIGTARQGYSRLGTATARNIGGRGLPEDPHGATPAAANRPDSAAFIFSLNKPKTDMDGNNVFLRGQSSIARPGATGRSQNNTSWDSDPADTFNAVRPPTRGSTGIFTEENVDFIPALEDVQEEDLTLTVADAPAYEIQRMASLKELDEDLVQSKPFSVVDGIDLRKLCRFLVPEKYLHEDQDEWTWDKIYSEIVSNTESSRFDKMRRKDADHDSEISKNESQQRV